MLMKDEALKKEEDKVLKWKKSVEREAANAKKEINKSESKAKMNPPEQWQRPKRKPTE